MADSEAEAKKNTEEEKKELEKDLEDPNEDEGTKNMLAAQQQLNLVVRSLRST